MKSLKECKSIQEAMPLIKGKPETFKTLVETAFVLKQNPDPAQKAIGDNFLAKAIREMDADEQPTPHHDDGIKAKGEHFVKEADLPGGNKSGTDGSEQSSSDKPQEEGTEEPVGDLEQPEMSTENQMKEGFPQMGQVPGLDPALAAQIAPKMGQMPPLNPAQQIQQMQYTVKQMVGPVVKELQKTIRYHQEAIKSIDKKVTESVSLKNGLDLGSVKERSITPTVKETIPASVSNFDNKVPAVHEKTISLEMKRNEIAELNKMLSKNPNQPYQ